MKKKKLILVLALLVCVLCTGCGKTNSVASGQADNNIIVDNTFGLLDSAVSLGVNGEYYESNALSIADDKQYVFKVNANKTFSTLYMYNAKRRMGNNFLDGVVPGQNIQNAYWQVRVYNENKEQMHFVVLHNLTSQLCTSSSWDDAYVFESGHTYYFVIDILANASGAYYFSLY